MERNVWKWHLQKSCLRNANSKRKAYSGSQSGRYLKITAYQILIQSHDILMLWLKALWYHTTTPPEGQTGAFRCGPSPHILDRGLHHQLPTVCEDLGLCWECLQCRDPQRMVLALFPFTLLTAEFSHLSTAQALRWLCHCRPQHRWGRSVTQRTYRGLMPVEPSPD